MANDVASSDRVNILLVDDEPANLLALEAVLGELGQNLVRAGSGEEALRRILETDFAVIIMDLRMPGLSGFETAKLIRSRPRSRATPVIFLTAADGDGFSADQAYSLGAVDYLTKPVVPTALRAKVTVFVELYRKTEALKAAERERADAAVRESEERLALAIAIARLGTFEIDFLTDAVVVNETGRDIFGWKDAQTTFSQVQAHFHPDDRDEVMRRVQSALDPSGSRTFELDQRIHRTDGSERWIRVRARTFFTGKGAELRAVRCLGTLLDITDRKQAEEALTEQSRRKDEFLATLAHELRNPLAPIRNAVSLLKLQPSHQPQKMLALLERQVTHMVRLVDDLLDISRVSRGKIPLKPERVSVEAVLHAALEVSGPAVEAGRHTLTVRGPDEPLDLHADRVRLAQVVSNLLNNAAKYTPPGGRIELSARREGRWALIQVADNGVGIEAEMLGEVFEMFNQVGKTLDRAQGGLGIGLALVKRLVELHGGTISADSPGLGLGSTFTVRLPLTPDTP